MPARPALLQRATAVPGIQTDPRLKRPSTLAMTSSEREERETGPHEMLMPDVE